MIQTDLMTDYVHRSSSQLVASDEIAKTKLVAADTFRSSRRTSRCKFGWRLAPEGSSKRLCNNYLEEGGGGVEMDETCPKTKS